MDSSFNYNLISLREAALTVLREVDSLTSRETNGNHKFGLQEEVQRYESELIRRVDPLHRTLGQVFDDRPDDVPFGRGHHVGQPHPIAEIDERCFALYGISDEDRAWFAAQLAKAFRRPFVYDGGYSPERRRRHGLHN